MTDETPRTPTTAVLDAAWKELVLDALASDGRISDADVKNAVARHRPRIEAEARAPLDVVRAILDEPCPFCHDASTIGCPESSHAIRSRLRAALEEPTP